VTFYFIKEDVGFRVTNGIIKGFEDFEEEGGKCFFILKTF